MPLFGSSTKQSVLYDTDTTTETTQADQSNNEGLNLAQISGSVGLDLSTSEALSLTDARSSVDNSVTQVLDGGALQIAGNIARESLALAGGGVQNALAANAGALNFGAQAVSAVSQVNADSLDVFGGLISGLIDTTKTATRDAISLSGDALARFSDFSAQATGDAVAGFGALAKQGAESTDDKVTKVAMYGLAALVAALVLPALFKGAKA